MLRIVSKNFAKTLDLKCKFDVAVSRHKQRTPSNNDHHTLLLGSRLAFFWLLHHDSGR